MLATRNKNECDIVFNLKDCPVLWEEEQTKQGYTWQGVIS